MYTKRTVVKYQLLENRKRFPQEYWPYYNMWMEIGIREINSASPDNRVLENVFNLIDFDYNVT